MTRLAGRSPWQLALTLLGLLLLLLALWGVYRSYPNFDTIRSVPATVNLPPPGASPAP